MKLTIGKNELFEILNIPWDVDLPKDFEVEVEGLEGTITWETDFATLKEYLKTPEGEKFKEQAEAIDACPAEYSDLTPRERTFEEIYKEFGISEDMHINHFGEKRVHYGIEGSPKFHDVRKVFLSGAIRFNPSKREDGMRFLTECGGKQYIGDHGFYYTEVRRFNDWNITIEEVWYPKPKRRV